MNIAFINNQKSYLPELKSYVNFLNDFSSWKAFEISESENYDSTIMNSFDVVWKFTGIDIEKKKEGQIRIHEYNSLSAGNFSRQKDYLKKVINIAPNGRVFLNKYVKSGFNFTDEVPFLYRDMGVASEFFIENKNKDYDFVYIGSMEPSRKIDEVLNCFRKQLKTQSILLIGTPSDNLYREFKDINNIIFTGKIPYSEVPKISSAAEYGINYVPDIYPYNIQTSTKLLEYCALGLKVISNNYFWMNQFERERNAHFFKLNENLSNLTVENLKTFNFRTPNIEDLEWNHMLKEIGYLNFLEKII